MRKSKPRVFVQVIATLFWPSVSCQVDATAQITSSTSLQQTQILARRIRKRAENFYKAFKRERHRPALRGEPEIDGYIEDFLLQVDALSDPLLTKRHLESILPLASAIERMLLVSDFSSQVVLKWAVLHADLDLLAKLHKLKWSEVVITRQLLASFAKEADDFLDEILPALPEFHLTMATKETVNDLLKEFRKVSLALEVVDVTTHSQRPQIEKLVRMSRRVSLALDRCALNQSLLSKWRHLSSQLEELSRLYWLDSDLPESMQAVSPL